MTRVGWRDVEGGTWKEGRGRRDVGQKHRDGRGEQKKNLGKMGLL